MIRRPPRSTLSSSSAASDVYKRQGEEHRVPVDARLAECAEEGAGSVVDEDPGQPDPDDEQGDVTGQRSLRGGLDLLSRMACPNGQVAHDRPSMALRIRNGCTSWATTTRCAAIPGASCSTGTGRPAIPVAMGAPPDGNRACRASWSQHTSC